MENRTEDVLERIEQHPLVKEIAVKKSIEILLQHKRAADAVAALKAELSSLPDPEEAVREKQAELDCLEAAAAVLRKEITKITAETRVARMRIEGRIKLLESNLMESNEALLDRGSEFSSLTQQSGNRNSGRRKEAPAASGDGDARTAAPCMDGPGKMKNRGWRLKKGRPGEKLLERAGSQPDFSLRRPSDARPGDIFDQWCKKLGEELSYWKKKLRL